MKYSICTIICLFSVAFFFGCVATSQQDQFGHAVMTGNTQLAKQNFKPGYGRMRIYPTGSDQPVTPIDYAIYHNDKELATFLVQNGCDKSFDGKNLTYYAASGGNVKMAEHFISLGEGSYSDIEQVKTDHELAQKQSDKEAAQTLAGFLLIGSVFQALSAGDNSSGEEGVCYNCKSGGVEGANGLCGSCTAMSMQ